MTMINYNVDGASDDESGSNYGDDDDSNGDDGPQLAITLR